MIHEPRLEFLENGNLKLVFFNPDSESEVEIVCKPSEENSLFRFSWWGKDFISEEPSLYFLPIEILKNQDFSIKLGIFEILHSGEYGSRLFDIFLGPMGVYFKGEVWIGIEPLFKGYHPKQFLELLKSLGEKDLFSACTLEWSKPKLTEKLGVLKFETILFSEEYLFLCIQDLKAQFQNLSFKAKALTPKARPFQIFLASDLKSRNPLLVNSSFFEEITFEGSPEGEREVIHFEIDETHPYEEFLLRLNGSQIILLSKKVLISFDRWMNFPDPADFNAPPIEFMCLWLQLFGYKVEANIMVSYTAILQWCTLHPDAVLDFLYEEDISYLSGVKTGVDFYDIWQNFPAEDKLGACVYFSFEVSRDISFQDIFDHELRPKIKEFFQTVEYLLLKLEVENEEETIIFNLNEEIRTALKQYLVFFNDFVKVTKKEEVDFEVFNHPEGLELVFRTTQSDIIVHYLWEYLSFIQKRADEVQIIYYGDNDLKTRQLIEIQLRGEIRALETRLEFANYKIELLEEQLKETKELLNFSKSIQSKPINLSVPTSSQEVFPHISASEIGCSELLIELKKKAIKMTERKSTHMLEDLHNDNITDWLRGKGYSISDQTRSGRSKFSAGELDIAIRKRKGEIVSIIEAFRLSSCGENNQIVSQHIDKLIHDYDSAGNECNFILVYCESKNFLRLWGNYFRYMEKLNSKPGFRAKYPLISFDDTRLSKKANMKVGLSKHEREGDIVKVYHILIDMSTY